MIKKFIKYILILLVALILLASFSWVYYNSFATSKQRVKFLPYIIYLENIIKKNCAPEGKSFGANSKWRRCCNGLTPKLTKEAIPYVSDSGPWYTCYK